MMDNMSNHNNTNHSSLIVVDLKFKHPNMIIKAETSLKSWINIFIYQIVKNVHNSIVRRWVNYFV
jgi:hypothetical protein